MNINEIRADFDDRSIIVYQAYAKSIALPALQNERTLRGKSLPVNSIQVGLSRHIIEKYVNEWTIEIQDATPSARKIYGLLQQGQEAKAKGFLPRERVYPLNQTLARQIGIR